MTPVSSSRKTSRARRKLLKIGVQALSELQGVLYAQDRWSVLIIFQAMDAAGKDGAIKHVMSGVNPQGCQVYFIQGAVSPKSSITTFCGVAWRRCQSAAVSASSIAATTRRHSSCASIRSSSQAKNFPEDCVTKDIWEQRFEDIRSFERYLTRNGTVVRKFFLHVSKDEQQKRFLERLDDPDKNWKFSARDAKERGTGTIHGGL